MRIPAELKHQFNTDFARRAVSLPESEPEHRLVLNWSEVALRERIYPESVSISAITSEVRNRYLLHSNGELTREEALDEMEYRLIEAGHGSYVIAVHGLGRAINDLKGRPIAWNEYDEDSIDLVRNNLDYIVGGESGFMGKFTGNREVTINISDDPDTPGPFCMFIEYMRDIKV